MFSVVIPAYNSEKTIYRALKSVVDQTRVDLVKEIIVIDDGSIDNTKCEIDRFFLIFQKLNYIILKKITMEHHMHEMWESRIQLQNGLPY